MTSKKKQYYDVNDNNIYVNKELVIELHYWRFSTLFEFCFGDSVVKRPAAS